MLHAKARRSPAPRSACVSRKSTDLRLLSRVGPTGRSGVAVYDGGRFFLNSRNTGGSRGVKRGGNSREGLEVLVRSVPFVPVRDAVVLAAGNGDRFRNGARQSKLLQPVLGQTLILRTLETAAL